MMMSAVGDDGRGGRDWFPKKLWVRLLADMAYIVMAITRLMEHPSDTLHVLLRDLDAAHRSHKVGRRRVVCGILVIVAYY